MRMCNEEVTHGEIFINVLQNTLEGHFMMMRGDGQAGSILGRRGFRARKHRGPSIVPYSLQNVVDEWNDLNFLAPDDIIRQDQSDEELEEYQRRRDEEKAVKRRRLE